MDMSQVGIYQYHFFVRAVQFDKKQCEDSTRPRLAAGENRCADVRPSEANKLDNWIQGGRLKRRGRAMPTNMKLSYN
jgi:hypothetical protein